MNFRVIPLVSMLLGAAMPFVGCGGADTTPVVDCSTVTVPTFSEVTIWPKCTACHSSTLTGSARSGAPEGIDYDTYASAVQHADAAQQEVVDGSMPFPSGSGLTEEEKQSLYAWVQCGTPE